MRLYLDESDEYRRSSLAKLNVRVEDFRTNKTLQVDLEAFGYIRKDDHVPTFDKEYGNKVAACLYATHHFGTNVYDMICQGCEPDPNNWPEVGSQPTAIHCGHSGLAPACLLYLNSKEHFFRAKRIAEVTKEISTSKERLKETTK